MTHQQAAQRPSPPACPPRGRLAKTTIHTATPTDLHLLLPLEAVDQLPATGAVGAVEIGVDADTIAVTGPR